MESLEPRALLATVTWDGGGGDLQWGNDLNWSTDSQPQLTDDVVIGNIGSPVSVNVPVNVSTIDSAVEIVMGGLTSFQAVSGNFAGGFSVTASNSVNLGTSTVAGGVWNAATVNGVITNTGSLSFPVLTVNVGQLINAGTLSITSNSSGAITNQATGTLTYLGGVHTGSISNAGTIVSGGTVTINASLDNTGIVDVPSGTLTVNGSVTQHVGASLTGGRWEVEDGGAFDLTSGSNITTLEAGASVVLDGSGTFAKLNTIAVNQGEFILFNKNFVTVGPFTNQGYLQLTNSSMSTAANDFTQSVSLSAVTQLENSSVIATNSFNLNTGYLFGNGTINGSVVNAATIAPGLSPGVLNIAGNYTQAANGVLNVEVQGTNPGTPDFDQLIVTGTATLDGTLNVTQTNNFLADKSESFRIIQTASRTGDFATKNLPQRNGLDLMSTMPGGTFYDLQGQALIVRNTNDAGPFSLRAQIALANNAGTDQILFNIATAGVQTLTPASFLDGITDPTIIDGTTQPLYSGTPLIEIDGTNAGVGVSGILLSAGSDGSVIKGLAINRFQDSGLSIQSSNNEISDNFIGTDPLGTLDRGNSINGIIVQSGATGNTIANNLVSGNNATGVTLVGNGNTVRGNKIGTNLAGTAAIANPDGVRIVSASGNTIGGTSVADRNLISGNSSSGVSLSASANGNAVLGNFIGTTLSGTVALPNASGITIANASFNNSIGGVTAGARNLISGNTQNGVLITGAATTGNQVLGNYIGVGVDGSSDLGNDNGVQVLDAPGNFIGSGAAGAQNVIAGNVGDVTVTGPTAIGNRVQGNRISVTADGLTLIAPSFGYGVYIGNGAVDTVIGTFDDGINDANEGNQIGFASTAAIYLQDVGSAPDRTVIAGNVIGLDASGATLSTGARGIWISGATNTRIGTDADGTSDADERNVIVPSVNGGQGILLSGGSLGATTGTTIAGNYVGLDLTGEFARSNTNTTGILLQAGVGNGVSNTVIGGTSSSAKNVVGSLSVGIELNGALVNNNSIRGNFIGTDKDGVSAIPNSEGIAVSVGADNNTIGGPTAASRNVISGNIVGVHVSNSDGTAIASNIVGLQSDGLTSLANSDTGIHVNGNSNNTTIGGVSLTMDAANYIAGGGGYGIALLPTPGTTGNQVVGNIIGLNQADQVRGNSLAGIIVKDTSNVTIGGTIAGSKNVISGSAGSGVWIYNASNTTVQGNYVGTDSTGELDRGNQGGIAFEAGSFGNTIGGLTLEARNIISGNDVYGVGIHDTGSDNNEIRGNYIGTDKDGVSALANGTGVVIDAGTANNRIGGSIANVVAGNPDTTFGGGDGLVTTNNSTVTETGRAVAIQSDGKIVVAGNSYSGLPGFGGVMIASLQRYNADGSIDTSFGGGDGLVTLTSFDRFTAVAIQSDGKIVVGGRGGSGIAVDGTFAVARFLSNGSIDTTFAGDGAFATGWSSFADGVESLEILSDGKILAAGFTDAGNPTANMVVAKINTNGTIDTTFGSGTGFRIVAIPGTVGESGRDIVVLPDGKFYVVGNSSVGFFVTRFNDNGSLDTSYDTDGIVVTSTPNSALAHSSVLQPDGKLLVSGSASIIGGTRDFTTARYNTDGSLDTTFGSSGFAVTNISANDDARSVLLQSDGKIVVSGSSGVGDLSGFAPAAGLFTSVRYSPNGAIDTTFGTNGIAIINFGNPNGDVAYGAALDGSENIILVGTSNTDFAVAKFVGVTISPRNVISGNTLNGITVFDSQDNSIQGNIIGLNALGNAPIANVQYGIQVAGAGDTSGNLIGGTSASARNIISGNTSHGIAVISKDGLRIEGNYIGTDITGLIPIGNADGIVVQGPGVTIGGTSAGAGNVISGNTSSGVDFYNSTNGILGIPDQSVVQGNLIGLAADGFSDMGNATYGIVLALDDRNVLIGGNSPAARNVIGGNDVMQIYTNSTVAGLQIQGNYIGLDATGLVARTGSSSAVYIQGPNVIVGGTTASYGTGLGNVILGSLHFASASGGTVRGNILGLGADGVTDPTSSATNGLYLQSSNGVIVGGLGGGNLISGNSGSSGIAIDGGGNHNIQANLIGTDISGTIARANVVGIVATNGSSNNTIGGSLLGAGNVISGNTTAGVLITGATSSSNKIQGNFIGTDAAGSVAIGNDYGIEFDTAGTNNIIGVDGDGINDAGEGNLISGNLGGGGVRVLDTNATIISGNIIGLDALGTTALPNESSFGRGIVLGNSIGSRIGTNSDGISDVLERNVVAANEGYDVQIDGTTSNTTVAGNYIGLDALGTTALSTPGLGAIVFFGGNNNLVGTNADGVRDDVERNVMAGIDMNFGASNNTIAGNYIGTDRTGSVRLPIASGVDVSAGAGTGNLIGGPTSASGNVIASVGAYGVSLNFAGQTVQNNLIGVDATGNAGFADPIFSGIRVSTNNHTIDRNVISGGWLQGILLDTSGNTITGNKIGTNASGNSALPNQTGIQIGVGGSSNTIGGTLESDRNVISGNTVAGIIIAGVGADSNFVQGNYIGTNATGNAALSNSVGIQIESSASNNIIGGATPGARNVISGNTSYGVQLIAAGIGNKIQGNYIGTDWLGRNAVGNAGVSLAGAAIRLTSMGGNTVYVGTDGDGLNDRDEGNLISGNFGNGVRIQGGSNDSGSHVVAGNLIGVNVDGNLALPNQNDGILVLTSRNNRIGTNGDGVSDALEANVISGIRNLGGNPSGPGIVPVAIRLLDSVTNDAFLNASNTIAGNIIGLNALGTALIGNQGHGIILQDSSSNVIGGVSEVQRNIISGNEGSGVVIDAGVLSDNNILRGNWIGLGSDGDTIFGNTVNGIQLLSGSGTLIGGFTSIPGTGAGNIISGNGSTGISINGSNGEILRGNLVGLDATGSRDRGNVGPGIAIANGTPHLIGGDDDDDGSLDGVVKARNVISGNSGVGITLSGGPQNVTIHGNYVGTNIDGTFAIPNSTGGIQIGNSYSVLIGGTTVGAGNLISGNFGAGISTLQQNLPLQTTTIRGNIVGTDATGSYAIPNSIGGISTNNLLPGSVTIGGGTFESRNLISGNSGYGIRMIGDQVLVEQNFIGTDLAGINALGNVGVGLIVEDSSLHMIRSNTISGNKGGGIRLNAGATSNVLIANTIGTSASGILALPNGTLLAPAFGVEFDGASTNILGSNPSNRNIISANYGDGVVLKNGASNNTVRFNWIGANAIDSAALGNSGDGVHMLGTTTSSNLIDSNLIYYNGGSALRLEDTTSTASSVNIFDGNDFRDNLGLTIDIGSSGPTLNDGLDSTANNLRDYPVITSASIVGEELEISGFSQPNARIDLFLSSPALNGRGQAVSQLASNLIEGTISDLDASTGTYGVPHAASTISANHFRFRLPLPNEVRFGTLITGVTIGSISEFSNVVAVGLTLADLANNLAPVVTIQPNATIATGESLALSGSFLDDDSTNWTGTVDYGDGTGTHVLVLDKVARTFSIDRLYSASGVYTVTIQIQDFGGKVGTASVSLLVQNEAPVLTYNKFTITSKVTEGGLVTLDGLFSDSGLTDQHVVTIDWGDGVTVQSNVPNPDVAAIPPGAQSFRATHRYIDDGVSNTPRDSYRVQVTVTDNGNLSDTSPDGLFIIEVVNVRPSNVAASLSTLVTENSPVVLTGSFVDPGILDAHSVKVNWGDGTSDVLPISVIGQRTFSLTHTYQNNPIAPTTEFVVTIEVSDDDEPLLPATLKKSITVVNALPSIASSDIVLSSSSIDENGFISLSASFADPGSADKHQVVIDWGDGSEPKTIDLAAGVTTISGVVHQYLDDPSGLGPNIYTVAVKVRDADMLANDFVVATQTVTVDNLPPAFVVPVLSPILTFTSEGIPVTGPLVEGARVTLTGQYTDPGSRDVPVVTIDWGDGTSSLAYVSSSTKTFTATHLFRDDNEATNGLITVTVDDQDGGSATTTSTLHVNNAVPTARILPKPSSNVTLVALDALASDLGIDDLTTLQYQWTVNRIGTGNLPIVTGLNSSNLLIDRNGNFADPYQVTLTVNDNEGGFVTQATHLILLDDNPNVFAPPLSSQPGGVDSVTIMGFAGADTLDLRNWTIPVILDGGANNDILYGGSADDVLVLHQGNDSGYGGGGADRYVMTFNSILTVEDDLGDNILDFSPTSFGVTFDLNLAVTSSSDLQDVLPSNPGLHQADIDGTFAELIGTNLGDRLTGTSGSLVDGGAGNDKLYSPLGLSSSLRFRGGLDDDLLYIDVLSEISEISFEGDVGADEFLIFGDVTTRIDFDGGADDDLLSIELDSVVNEVSFEGDVGADEFLVLGDVTSQIDFDGGADVDVLTIQLDSIVNEVSFEGDFGADEFILLGDVTSSIDFEGGADDDLLVIQLDSVVNEVSFEGDMGADDFYVFGEVTNLIEFNGGADDDLLSIELTSEVLEVSFEGDFGADEFLVLGDVGTIVFDGGADDDLLELALNSSVNEVSFEGDVGADEFIIFGEVTGLVEFSGGADSDLFELATTSILNEVSFEGDDGRDRFVVQGTILATDTADDPLIPNVPGSLIPRDFSLFFRGGNDDDVLTLGTESILLEVSFEGDFGADEFYVFTDDITLIDFNGGADDDLLYLGTTSLVEEVSFEGDFGADELYIYGDITSTIDFNGGADDDLLVLGAESTVVEISFEGDFGADEFYVYGDVTQMIDFQGGADDDLLVFGIESSLLEVSFEGDFGADEFYILGEVGGLVYFDGGADDDLLSLAAESTVSMIDFEGDTGADELLIFGDVVNSIEFSGGADGDRLHNRASGFNAITFYGFVAPTEAGAGVDGKDLFVNSGSSIGSITFLGGLDDDVLYTVGNDLLQISFEGDVGADIFIVDGTTLGSIDFDGGADDDVLSITGTEILEISFEGDDGLQDGADTLINRARGAQSTNTLQPSTIYFNGLGGIDAFRNDGNGWDGIVFLGGSDNDAFQNNADAQNNLRFEGDTGNDVFENNGSNVSTIVYLGGFGNDVFVNDGISVTDIQFSGGNDDDLLLNTGNLLNQISFEGDEGNDSLINFGESVEQLIFSGGDGDERWINSARDLRLSTMIGGAGKDVLINRSTAIGLTNFRFESGGNDDAQDRVINFADQVVGLYFEGGAEDDWFQNSGFQGGAFEFLGGDGDDTALNLGAELIGWSMTGGQGNDVLENRANGVKDLKLDGGFGDDMLLQRGSNVTKSNLLDLNKVAVELLGGPGIDVLANFGTGTLSLRLDGGTGNDRLLNSSSNVQWIEFLGGDGNDALQNNSPNVEEIHMLGENGEDSLFNNGSSVRLIQFDGGLGADTLINTGSSIGDALAAPAIPTGIQFWGGDQGDLLRVGGRDLVRLLFEAGSGDDSLLYNASGMQVDFLGGLGDDIFSYRGAASLLLFEGNQGNDRIVYAGTTPNLGVVTSTVDGGDGDDRYEFTGTPQGFVRIEDAYLGMTDGSSDTLDFSAFTSGSLTLDLASILPQSQPGSLRIQLSDGMGLERVLGSSGADVIHGNDRDNYIGGAQFFYPTSTLNPIPYTRPAQWVYLDFDNETNGAIGEHVYTTDERDEIQRRVEGVYYGYEADGMTPRSYSSPDRWFNVRFTQSLSEIANAGVTEFVTIRFNGDTPSGRPGGDSSEIDLANQNYGGTAIVQVNGLLGGIEVPVPVSEDFVESLPEDAEQSVGQDKPPATSENFVALSVKIAAHELAHLLGLRHYDAFGPVGFGIHSPPGVASFKPQYQGASAAFETFDHIIGSPASVGTTRANDVGQLFFGEREAVKIAVSMSDTSDVVFPESILPTTTIPVGNTVVAARQIELATIQVPNTLAKGINSAKNFYVQAASVIGSIGLDGASSESDFYSFSGQAGDLVTIELGSRSMRRFTNNGIDGYIDSILRLRDQSGQIVQAFLSDAVNDDEFESSDSLLMDIRLPSTGTYSIEVDTFARLEGDEGRQELLDAIALLESISNPSQNQLDALSLFIDSRDDTDVGSYQLFIYNFAKANRLDLIDTLEGRGGVDILDGGPGEDYSLRLGSLPATATSVEGSLYSATISFTNPGATSWSVSVDYGDGTPAISYPGITPQTGITLSHVYADNGLYNVLITVINDDLANVFGSFEIAVSNVAPVPTIDSISSPRVTGTPIALSGSATDAAGVSDTVTLNWQVFQDLNPVPTFVGSGATFSFLPVAVGNYTIRLTASDEDGGVRQVESTIAVANGLNHPPQIAIQTPVDGVFFQASTIQLTSSDSDAIDQSGAFTYRIDWGDGSPVTVVTGASTITVSHVYSTVSPSGAFTIRATTTDSRGLMSNEVATPFIVLGWAIMADPLPGNEGDCILVVVGSQGSDAIKIKDKSGDYLRIKIKDREDHVKYKGTVQGDVDRILVFGHGGDDDITLDDDIEVDAIIWGGLGNDKIKGGEGDDILFGDAGNDILYGRDGRDLLIGGTGADKIYGDSHDDILIAGYTIYDSGYNHTTPLSFDDRRSAIESIMKEWTSCRTYAQRQANILGTGSGLNWTSRRNGNHFLKSNQAIAANNTVFDDFHEDSLWGDSGVDWFFANIQIEPGTVADRVRDRSSSESQLDIDRWW